MPAAQAQGLTRQHRFFCTNRERHAEHGNVVAVEPKELEVFGRRVRGWLVTTEEPVIDKFISLAESMQGEVLHHDPE